MASAKYWERFLEVSDCRMSRVMVTGSEGFIGTALVRRLVDSTTHSVVEIRNRRDCDMSDPVCLARRVIDTRPDVIVHLAASPDSGAAGKGFERNTVMAVRNLAAVAQNRPCRIIYVGSYKQYGDAEIPFRETARVNPNSYYGHSKQLAETVLRQAERSGFCGVTSLRMGPVFGPGQSPASLLARLVRAFTDPAGRAVVGIKPWDPVYIDDAVDAVLAVLDSDRSVGRTFNVSGGISISPRQMSELIGAELGLPAAEIRRRTTSAENMGWSCLGDISLIRAALGWRPRVSHRAGVRLTINAALTGRSGR